MSSKSAELAEEQAYFDRAHKHRERHRAELDDTPAAAAHPGAARRLLSWVKARTGANRPADEAVAFGRIDDESQQTLYIGHEVITGEDREVLVVSWKAPAAQPYYQATHADRCGLVRKRSFLCTGNQVTDFEDVVFQQLAKDIAALDGMAGLDDLDTVLLSELDRPRDGSMRDIVATIQAAQYELIRSPLDQVLVIEGGPGTGKTAVALHRVSHLLYHHRDRLSAADVLVVGPNPAFTSYIRTVLPALGDAEVVHRDVGQLAPQVQRGRSEPVEVGRLKGEARMARLLARALDARVGTPEPAERMLFDGRFVTLSGVEVAAVVAACRQAPGPYAQRRGLLRARLHDLARERGAPTDRERLEPVENLVDRLWPLDSAPAFLRGLLGSRRRLAAAAGDDLTPQEVALLQRKGADRLSNEIWSAADLPLLDEVEDLINGVSQRYQHVVVDEAQDLSPMQLRSVARRSSTGSLTVVGDLAQSTGAWARDSWDDVLSHLPGTLPRNVVALRYGYRVPRRVYRLAARLLPLAAPHAPPLSVVREGPADPGIHRVDPAERAGRAVAVATSHAAAGRFVGLVCPSTCRAELEQALADNQVGWGSADRGELGKSVNLVSPQEAKGLEFDAVVVIEPQDIVDSDERGHRVLFTALTRTTRYLDIVCAGEPLPLSRSEPPVLAPAARKGPEQAVDLDELDRLAEELAAAVTGRAPAPLWDEVLQRTAAILDRHAQRPEPSGRHRRD
ncbi:MAG TPA: UvrD-helicase domain-containing protein [Micromonosporaceae bacterium]|nr:UvrD-helicase domain-containing protein [Micromonosporaceae bacterium]